jgi:Na+/proline symporter
MVLSSSDLWVMAIFMTLFIGVALSFTRRASGSLGQFFLGGRNLPWYVAGTSMVATTFAADTPLAVTELVAQHGISGNWLWWNMLAGGMLTTFFFARYWRRAGVLTDIELIHLRYSGKPAYYLRLFKALYMGIFLNVLIMGWVNLAFITLLKVFFGLDEATSLAITGGVLIVVMIYSSLSGLLGVVYADLIQFLTAMTGSIVLAIIILDLPDVGGVSGLRAKLPEESFSFFPNLNATASWQGLSLGIGSFLAYVTIQWWASWYPGNEPGGGGYIAQRMMSARNEKHAVFSSLFFQFAHYCIRPWPWILVALASLVLYPGLEDPKEGYVLAMRDHLPDGLRGLLLVAFLAAYMSTLSTQLNWGASYLVNDFYKPLMNREAALLWVSRMATILLALLALWVTTQMDSISGVWQFLMECGAGLGLVLILRWYWWRINAWTEIVATLMPFLAYTVGHYGLKWIFPESFFFTVGVTVLAIFITAWVTPTTKREVLKSFYDRVQPDGLWRPVGRSSGSFYRLLFLWLFGVLSAYSLLFFTGSLILQGPFLVYLLIFLVSLTGLVFLTTKWLQE